MKFSTYSKFSKLILKHGLLLAFSFFTTCALGQGLPLDKNTKQAYKRHTRDHSGLPAKAYWQNQGNYKMDISFDPKTRKVVGTVHIEYINNSPDTLKRLLFKVYPNLYKANSMRNTVIATADLTTGLKIVSMEFAGKPVDSSSRIINGTNLSVKGVKVLPHGKIAGKLSYEYTLNKGSFNRTGQIDSGSYFIAYFFPRIAVYDDIDGWNEYPYLGKEEFYNDYGNFDVSIKVPGNYSVWATGDLINPEENFQEPILDRIRLAEKSDTVVNVITKADVENQQVTLAGAEHTWKFKASNVTDFAFALSNNYIWKSASIMVDRETKRRTRVDAVYHPNHDRYEKVIDYNRKTVEIMSNKFPAIPFPYSHMTIVDGLDAMEYPMMVNNLPFEDDKDIIEFTSHEVFHSLFPFYVGTNETKYSFMDEGWATLTEFMFHPWIAPEVPLNYDMSPVNDAAGLAEDMPVMTPTAQLYGAARFADKDLKPALALWYLRDMLGEEKFASATRYFIRTWAGKHPSPYDFFNAMAKGSATDLNWFWKRWYFEKSVPDLSIRKVALEHGNYKVVVTNEGGAPVPIHLTAYLSNGKTLSISRSADVWKNIESYELLLPANSKILKLSLASMFFKTGSKLLVHYFYKGRAEL